MGFANADEVERYLGGIFQDALADEELGPKLRATGISLKTAYTEPEVVLVIDLANGIVRRADESAEAGAVMRMSADTGNAYWQGKVNLPLSMAKGKVKVQGDIAALLKLAPLSKRLIPAYIQRLTDEGRTDLLV